MYEYSFILEMLYMLYMRYSSYHKLVHRILFDSPVRGGGLVHIELGLCSVLWNVLCLGSELWLLLNELRLCSVLGGVLLVVTVNRVEGRMG